MHKPLLYQFILKNFEMFGAIFHQLKCQKTIKHEYNANLEHGISYM